MKKVLLFQPSCPNRQYCKLGAKKFLPFLLMFFHQLRRIITGRHIRNDFFFDSIFFYMSYNPVNHRLDEDALKTSWRRLSSSSSEDVCKTSWSRWIYSSYSSSEDVFEMSWSRPIYLSWSYVFKTSSIRLQDILEDLKLLRWRSIEDVFKTKKYLLGIK